jgi:hypothetical protein
MDSFCPLCYGDFFILVDGAPVSCVVRTGDVHGCSSFIRVCGIVGERYVDECIRRSACIPVLVPVFSVRFFHGSVTRQIILVHHLITLSFFRADKYPKSPGLHPVTPGFNGTTPKVTE